MPKFQKVTYAGLDVTALTVDADQKGGWIDLIIHIPDKSGQWVPLPDAGRHRSQPAPHVARITGPNIKVTLAPEEDTNG